MQADPLRLQQILTNLLSNAIRYTERGYVNVSLETLPDQHWSIAVSDSGIGMAPADQKHIFEPYFRVDDTPRAETDQGTGLGLAVVWQLVDLMQGKILVSSQLGRGSTFTVVFPVE